MCLEARPHSGRGRPEPANVEAAGSVLLGALYPFPQEIDIPPPWKPRYRRRVQRGCKKTIYRSSVISTSSATAHSCTAVFARFLHDLMPPIFGGHFLPESNPFQKVRRNSRSPGGEAGFDMQFQCILSEVVNMRAPAIGRRLHTRINREELFKDTLGDYFFRCAPGYDLS